MGSTRQGRHVLIIGGMGPHASLYAHKKLLDTLAATGHQLSNAEYPRITHLSINVEDFISDSTAKRDALKYISGCLQDINLATVDSGFIACNTAHVLYPQLKKQCPAIRSLVKAAREEIRHRGITTIGLLSTPTTIKSHLYDMAPGCWSIVPTKHEMEVLEDAIRHIISGGDAVDVAGTVSGVADSLIRRGADAILLGCTELSMLSELMFCDVDIIDPMGLVIREVVCECSPTHASRF